jgi:hypothetical protein
MERTEREKNNGIEFNDEEWTVVAPRRRREDKIGKGRTDSRAQVISFYFTNFPDEVSLQDLRYRFTRLGEVVDIFIPGKKNKHGNFFGFVRLKGVTETSVIEDKMREIWFGSFKLWANVARFEKERGDHKEQGGKRPISDGRINKSVKKTRKHNETPKRDRNIGWDRTKTGNLSYAEAASRRSEKNVEGKRNSVLDTQQNKQEQKREWKGLAFETELGQEKA